MKLQFLSGLLTVALGTSGVSADVLVYTGDHTPDANVVQDPNTSTYGSLFSTTFYGGTGWSSSGGVLSMATAYEAGVWFGTTRPGSGYNDISGFQLSDNTAGSSLSMTAALVEGATSWGAYFYDLDGYSAYIGLNDVSEDGQDVRPGVWVYSADGGVRVTDDLFKINEFHKYEMHIQGGLVEYKIDDRTVLIAASSHTPSPGNQLPGLTVIGDGSGSTKTGTGSMLIDHLVINNAAGPVPEPASAVLGGLGVLCLGARRRRA